MANRNLILLILTGIGSGLICAVAGSFLSQWEWLVDLWPGLIFGTALWVSARLLDIPGEKDVLHLIWVIGVSGVAWRLAVDVGFWAGDWNHYETAGALGGFTIALGLYWIWRRNGFWVWIPILTLAGALGGVLFLLIEKTTHFSDNDDLWSILLFTVWQTIFLLGIGLAHRATQNQI